MVGAHTPMGSDPVRAHGRLDARREAAFGLVELVVVMLIVAIMLAVALPHVRNANRAADAGTLVVAGATLWRAVSDHRQDYRGAMPATPVLVGLSKGASLDTFRSPSGERYLRRWPGAARSDARIPLQPGRDGAAPPRWAAGSPTLVYFRSRDSLSGYVAGYASDGTRVFCRGVAPADPGAWTNGRVLGARQC